MNVKSQKKLEVKNIKNLTVQQWIPMDKIYNDGIIKLKENKFNLHKKKEELKEQATNDEFGMYSFLRHKSENAQENENSGNKYVTSTIKF